MNANAYHSIGLRRSKVTEQSMINQIIEGPIVTVDYNTCTR